MSAAPLVVVHPDKEALADAARPASSRPCSTRRRAGGPARRR